METIKLNAELIKSNAEIIKCENLCMSYENKIVFKDLSFSAKQGDFIAVAGENGSGKSTLAKGILGLKKYKGTLTLGIKRSQTGYLPQNSLIAGDIPVTAGEVVLSGCLNGMGFTPFYNDSHRKKARDALSQMCASELEKRYFGDLSGGQKQRVLIARALCAADKLLLLDEPATGLDVAVRHELYELIKALNENFGLTVIMISHDLEGALNYAGKILHISAYNEKNSAISENYENSHFFGIVEDYIKTPVFKIGKSKV